MRFRSKKKKFLLVCLLVMLSIPVLTRARGGDEYSQMPFSGKNFQSYSSIMFIGGRCYLLAPVQKIVTEAYAALETTCPDKKFVYMEMGWKGGGRFPPHRTHRKGISADFLTPMLHSATATPGQLPLSVTRMLGYGVRLTPQGTYEDLRLDTEGMICHLSALEEAARKHGWKIQRVIFDPPLLALLQKAPNFNRIRNIPFMQGKAWFPHDGHYHVDFSPV